MLQPEMEVEVPPGAFNKADHMTSDWWGYRERLFASGVEVFAFYNSMAEVDALIAGIRTVQKVFA